MMASPTGNAQIQHEERIMTITADNRTGFHRFRDKQVQPSTLQHVTAHGRETYENMNELIR